MDVYDDSPTIVTIWLTIMPKISILILLLEIYTQLHWGFTAPQNLGLFLSDNISQTAMLEIKNLLLISSLLSLIIGTLVGLAQTHIKRLLAYSTISHIGFILLALAISTQQSIESFMFYIIQYSITNLNIFLILIGISLLVYNTSLQNFFVKIIKNNFYFTIMPLHIIKPLKFLTFFINIFTLQNLFKIFSCWDKSPASLVNLIKEINKELIETDIKYITDLKGQFFSNPLISLSLSICLFSMAGIPPLIGFFSKQFVLYSAVLSGYFFISIIAILVSVISASYYLKIIKVLHDKNINNSIKNASILFFLSDKEKIKLYSSPHYVRFSILKLMRAIARKIYSNIKTPVSWKDVKKKKDLFHANYFKEIQLIYIFIFIFKFNFLYKSFINNLALRASKLNKNIHPLQLIPASLVLDEFWSIKDSYTNKEFWQLNNSEAVYLPHILQPQLEELKDLNNIKENPKKKIIFAKSKDALEAGENINFKYSSSIFFYQLTNYHSFLISNLTIIILFFFIKPSILLSSTRLLSLSIFTY